MKENICLKEVRPLIIELDCKGRFKIGSQNALVSLVKRRFDHPLYASQSQYNVVKVIHWEKCPLDWAKCCISGTMHPFYQGFEIVVQPKENYTYTKRNSVE